MRLIDADSLKGLFDPGTWQGDMLIKAIDDAPTVLDIDKIIDDITDLAGRAQTKGEYKAYWRAARLLKGAVKNGN
jgi:hypothetical protein